MTPRDSSSATAPRVWAVLDVSFVFWLSGWTFFCVQMTIGAFFGNAGINWWLVAASIPFWFGEIVVVHYVLWYFFSSTTLTFRVDEFAIEKSLWRYRNRRVIRRTDVKLVKQIKDGGEDEDSFPSWGLLIVVGDEEINVLTRQPIEKSDWLGPLLAKWAEVELYPLNRSSVSKSSCGMQ